MTSRLEITRWTLDLFWKWFECNHSRFNVPLQVSYANKRCVILEFVTPTPCLSVTLWAWDLSIHAYPPNNPEDSWDILKYWDANPIKEGGQWFCLSCRDNTASDKLPLKAYQSAEVLIVEHVFEEFLTWTNNTLAKADALGLYGINGDFTWAKLLSTEVEDTEANHLSHRIPLK